VVDDSSARPPPAQRASLPREQDAEPVPIPVPVPTHDAEPTADAELILNAEPISTSTNLQTSATALAQPHLPPSRTRENIKERVRKCRAKQKEVKNVRGKETRTAKQTEGELRSPGPPVGDHTIQDGQTQEVHGTEVPEVGFSTTSMWSIAAYFG
jgi:hypothetical protein